MRPLEITLTAFRSYDTATVDLRDHDLVVITGDTGAGKTTLLDAVAFALFGRTPEQSRVAELLTLGHTHGEVRLTFAARGEVWRVVRRYGKDAPDPALLMERLDGDGGAVIETLAGEAAAGARLGEVVGMSFGAFTSAVLLAQGRFAEFLTAQPRDRDAILRELFGVASLEGARQAAVSLERVALAEADLRAADATALAPHGPAARTAAARAAREAAGAHAAARALDGLAARVRRRREEAAEAVRRRDGALAAAAELPDRDEAGRLAEALRATRRDAAEADARRSAAGERRAALAAEREALRARHGAGAAELAGLHERASRVALRARELPGRERTLTERESDLDERRAALAARARELADLETETRRLDARDAALARWRAAAAACEQATRGLAAAREDLARAAAERAAAEAALAAAEAAEREARRHDLAATLQHGLAPGDPCPVCGAAVGEHLPQAPHLAAGEKETARARAAAGAAGRAWAGADERVRAAERAAREAQEALAHEEAGLSEAGIARDPEPPDPRAGRDRDAALEAVRASLRDEERALAQEAAHCAAERTGLTREGAESEADRASLGTWADHADPVAALAAAVAETGAAEAAAEGAASEEAAAADAAASAHAEVARLESGRVAELRATAARVAARGRLPAPADGLAAEDLIAAALGLRDAVLAAAAAHAERADRAHEAAAQAQQALAGAGAAIGVAEPDQLPAVARALEAARGGARARLAEVEAAAARARRLHDLAEEARRRARLHHQVATDLRANAFPRFLLARYRERLAVGASARLYELTGGAYRFAGTDADPLAVVDLRRGERRRGAATLSGGERFLASLALALGLSDVAAESGGRLDCLFLDEGFSTLDAESLEQALAGVERLAGDGRLVAVITHLPGVAERLGGAIHVRKDPATGTSVVSAGMVAA